MLILFTRLFWNTLEKNVCVENLEYMKIYYLIKNKKMELVLRSSFEYKFEEVVNNMGCLIRALREKSNFPQKYTNLEYKEIYKYKSNNRIRLYELLGFSSREMNNFIKMYLSKAKSVTHKNLYINGKIRKIDMYKGNSEGYGLRNIHNRIEKAFSEIIDLNDNSYAYRKNKSILDCVENHLESEYFLKLDICNFFNSITKRNLNKILKMSLCYDGVERYETNLKGETSIYKSFIINDWDGVERLLNLCFVNGRLSLGLTTSPFLSNLYMDFFDRRFHQRFPELVYTRYSDDILISSKGKFDNEEVMNYINQEMTLLSLNINPDKTKYFN